MAATSAGETLWPPVLIMSSARPSTERRPSGPILPRSEVVNQPSSSRAAGQVGAVAVAGEQDGAGDLDPAVGGGAQLDAVQGEAVVDAAAAGLRHAVGGDDPGARGPGAGEQAGRDGRAAEQDRAERRQARARVQHAAQLRGDQGGVAAAERGQVALRRVQPVHHHRGAVPETRDRTSMPRPAMWLVGSGQSQRMPGSAPIRSRLARAEAAALRAELDSLGLAGGAGGGYHDRRAVRQIRPGAGRGRAGVIGAPSYGTVFGFYRGRSEGVQQIGDPGLRQARVKREDRGTAAVQRRRQRVEQAAGPAAGGSRRACRGRPAINVRLTGKTPAEWEGQRDRLAAAGTPAVTAPGPGPGGGPARRDAGVRHPDADPLPRHHGARGRADRGAAAGASSRRSPSTGRGSAPAGWPVPWRRRPSAGPRRSGTRCR